MIKDLNWGLSIIIKRREIVSKLRVTTINMCFLLVISGCSSTEVVQQPNLNVSIGQQFIDLKKAYDSGALTEKEFQRQKARLIDSIR